MDSQTIEPQIETTAKPDPVMERAMFFMDLEIAELTAVIPQAAPPEPKFVY